MYVTEEKIKEAITLFEEQGGVLRTSEALAKGIHRRTLYHMLGEDNLLDKFLLRCKFFLFDVLLWRREHK